MSPRSARIEELYQAALKRPADDRARFLAGECGGDSDLRRAVEQLLAGETRTQTIGDVVSRPGKGLEAGEQIGPYRIVERLGAGGMGEVFRAQDVRLGRMVALKRLHPEWLPDRGRRSRFLQEARTASALNHPNIVTFYDLVEAAGEEFLALEYVAGKTLDRVIPRHGLPLREALNYAIQMADGLAAAHAAGVIHRDLKPANIIVGEKGAVKLLDFGLAKLTEGSGAGVRDSTELQTAAGAIVGTLSYMSPEQAQGRPADARSDIFSFGCVLHEMITGRIAFRGDSPAATLSAILRDEPDLPSALRSDVAPDLDRIVQRCLRKDASRRFQHADDLKAALLDTQDQVSALPAASGESGQAGPGRSRRVAAIATVAGGLALAAGGWFLYRQMSRDEAPFTAVPFTSLPGYELSPAFSPDGNQVAFEGEGDQRSNHDIYVKLVGPGEPLRLTTDPARDHSPAWSPDGRSIAFIRDLSDERAAVLLLPALGGAERKLTETAAPSVEWPFYGTRALAWTPDGQRLVVSDKAEKDGPLSLFLLSIETGERTRLTAPKGPIVGDRSPSFSPDGKLLAFSRTIAIQSNDIYVLPLTADQRPGGEPKPLTDDHRWNDGAIWFDAGSELMFSSNRDGSQGLWRMPASGAQSPRRVPLAGEEITFPAFSRSARRLMYAQRFQDGNLWSLSLPESSGAPATDRLLVSSSRLDGNGDYSPDKRRITFQSNRSGNLEIWVTDHDGSHARQLTAFGHGHSGSPRWSPDGKWIAFDSNADGQYQVYVVDAEGGAPRRVTEPPHFNGIPIWSRDSQWILFSSGRSGRGEIWKMPASGGPSVQVTDDGGLVGEESPDGSLYYLRGAFPGPGTYSLWQRPVGGGTARQVIPDVLLRNFAISTEGIYYARGEQGGGWTLRLFRPATGAETMVRRYDKQAYLGLRVSLDGRELLYTQIDQEGSDLMMVENFR